VCIKAYNFVQIRSERPWAWIRIGLDIGVGLNSFAVSRDLLKLSTKVTPPTIIVFCSGLLICGKTVRDIESSKYRKTLQWFGLLHFMSVSVSMITALDDHRFISLHIRRSSQAKPRFTVPWVRSAVDLNSVDSQ